jgi:glycosyltransferase involved in cell wall biosynthesis
MRLALIADTFPPLRTSGAVQLRDLSREFVRQGHTLTVILPSHEIHGAWELENTEGAEILRLRAPRTKDVGYLRRTICESIMPFCMLRNFRKSPLARERWDGVVWYAPSIFLAPVASALKEASGCKSYLIIRDIFPEWAADMGLMGRGLVYEFFRAVARHQYAVADVIGVQTPGNLVYFDEWGRRPGRRAEVLQNWLAAARNNGCSISLAETALAGRTVLVYAGNMGIAQGVDIFIELADRLRTRDDVGFLFVGRGTDVTRLEAMARARGLSNVVFHGEVDPDEIPGLYAQCHIGLVALDTRHRTHNIPGKFLTYMQSGLPVLAAINGGNDLVDLIRTERVGGVVVSRDLEELVPLTTDLVENLKRDTDMAQRCRALFRRMFLPEAAARQISVALGAIRVSSTGTRVPPKVQAGARELSREVQKA